MTDLAALADQVFWADHSAGAATRELLEGEPALGRLADLAEWIATVRPATPDGTFGQVRVVVFGVDAVSAAAADAVLDGTSIEPMGTLPDDVAAAVSAGAAAADAAIDRGADLLVAAGPDPGAPSAVAVAVLTNTEPVKVLTRGVAATDPDTWMNLAIEVRDGRRRCMGLRDDPDQLLVGLGSPALAAAAGFVLQAAARRTPVLLDGPMAVAAALVAYEAQPRAVRWWYPADSASTPAHEITLTRLGLRAVLDLGCAVGDGTTGLLAVPVLRAAARLVPEQPDEPEPAEDASPDTAAG